MDLQQIITSIQASPLLTFFPPLLKGSFAAYFIFKILDFATGLLKTWKGVSNFKSPIMRNGIIRWIGELLAICFVLTVDIVFGLEFYLTTAVVALFAYKEGGSVAENITALGVQMPGIVNETIDTVFKVQPTQSNTLEKESEDVKNEH